MGRVFYVSRFILALAELLELFQNSIEERCIIQVGKEHQEAFQKVENVLSSPQTTVTPGNGLPLNLNKSIGALLEQEVEEV